MDRELVALGDGVGNGGEVGEVDTGRDALGVEIESKGDEVDVTRPLAIAEETALDAVATGEESELCSGDAGAAVIVRVE